MFSSIFHGRLRRGSVFAAVALACAVPGAARAALGDTVQSVAADQAKLHAAAVRSRAAAQYTMQEMTLSSGTVVREFISSSGTVFGVSWQGAVPPDLQQLLGTYFPAFVSAPRTRYGRGYAAVRQGNLVVENMGHTGAMRGHAYLSDRLPAGVSAAEIW